MSRDRAQVQPAWRNVISHSSLQGIETINGQNPQWWLQLPEVLPMSACRILEVVIQMQSPQADMVRVYAPIGAQDQFEVGRSLAQPVHALEDGRFETLSFMLENATGFGHQLRIDLAASNTTMRLKDIELRCKLRVPS